MIVAHAVWVEMATMSTRHPVERADGGRGRFERLAERGSNFTSSPTFFGFCFALVVAWAAAYVFGASSDAKDLLGYGMAAVSLMLLALLKNSERRAEQAVLQKLDAIASVLLEQQDGDAEHAREELREAIRVHEEV
jgi:low affinity Fe/Cu permease